MSAINKLDGEGVPEVLDINMNETDGKIIYQVEVLDTSTGATLSSITLDKHGNIKIEAQKIVYEVNEVEYR